MLLRPEVGRPTLPRLHRERRLDAGVRRIGGIAGRFVRGPAGPQRPLERRDGRLPRVDHRLVAGRGGAQRLDPVETRAERGQEHLAVRPIRLGERRADLAEPGPVQRTRRPPDPVDERRANLREERSPGDPSGDDCSVARAAANPALHVHPVVGIADRRVELGEEVTLFARSATRPRRSNGARTRRRRGTLPADGGADTTPASRRTAHSVAPSVDPATACQTGLHRPLRPQECSTMPNITRRCRDIDPARSAL